MTKTNQPELGKTGIQAIILAGGFGTRLQSVCSDRPKPMVPVLGRPFLDYLVQYLGSQGINEIVLSTGYMGEQVQEYYGGCRTGPRVRCVREPMPMGTGGAIAYVHSVIPQHGYFLVSNGDSLTPFALADLVNAVQKGGADAAIVGVPVAETGRFGSLAVRGDGMLAGFHEKASSGESGVISAGLYFLHPALMPAGDSIRPASVETDYFPAWLAEGKKIAVVPSRGPFIDIGTPESLAEASCFVQTCGLFSGGS